MNIFNTIANFFVGVVVTGLSFVGIDTPLTPPTLSLTANPSAIQIESDSGAVIEWSAKGADECTSAQFDTGGATKGNVTVLPTKTTTYTVKCSKALKSAGDAGVWRYASQDITDLWCTSQQPSFKNLYTENECPSPNPEGQSCSELADFCAVNHWQTKGGGVGSLGSQQYCNLVSEIYRCVPSNGTAQAQPAQTASTKVVYSGDFGSLVAPHLSYRAVLQKDVSQNGGIFTMDGFYDDKATANRVCAVLFPGSTNGTFQSDKYKSPKNNTVLRWDGTKWTQQNAKSHPRHLRYSFTCVAPADPKPADPPQQPLTVTKSITVIVLSDDGEVLPSGDGGGAGGTSTTGGGETGSGVGNPQCSDGIDNNGDGLIDYPDDPSCTSASGAIEVPLPDAEISLVAASNLVQQGKPARLTWAARNVQSDSCVLSGSDGSLWNLSGDGALIETQALTNETDFTLQCTDLRNKEVSVGLKVRIVPSFQEI